VVYDRLGRRLFLITAKMRRKRALLYRSQEAMTFPIFRLVDSRSCIMLILLETGVSRGHIALVE